MTKLLGEGGVERQQLLGEQLSLPFAVLDRLEPPPVDMVMPVVTKRRFVYSKELDCLVEIGVDVKLRDGPQTISDYEPYMTVAGDVAADGARVVIGGRAQHREFVKRNGYVEIGNEFNGQAPLRRPDVSAREMQARRVEAIKRTIDDYRSGRIARGEVSRAGER